MNSSNSPDDDLDNGFDDALRALELVQLIEQLKSVFTEFFRDLAQFQRDRDQRQLGDPEFRYEPETDPSAEYDPVRPYKIDVIGENEELQRLEAWILCAMGFMDQPTWVYVDANTGQTYIAQAEDPAPTPFDAEDLSNYYSLAPDEVRRLVAEIERQGRNLVFISSQVE